MNANTNAESTDKTLDEIIQMDEDEFLTLVADFHGWDRDKVSLRDTLFRTGKEVHVQGEKVAGPGASVSQLAREMASDDHPRTLSDPEFFLPREGVNELDEE